MGAGWHIVRRVLLSVERRLAFLSTPWGRIAYAVVGQGPPLLLEHSWLLSLAEDDDLSSPYRAFVERLASRYRVIRFDELGGGLSQTDVADVGFEAQLGAIECLLSALHVTRLSCVGLCDGGALAAAFAARHPEKVGRLVTYASFADGSSVAPPAAAAALLSLFRSHWGLGSKTLADIFLPAAGGDDRAWFARVQRRGNTGASAARHLQALYDVDVRSELAEIRAPALILHPRGDRSNRYQLGVQFAAMIPGAQFATLGGANLVPAGEEWAELAEVILDFLLEPDRSAAIDSLTGREKQVASLIAQGYSNSAIASTLGISPKTAAAHVEHIRNKLTVGSRAQIAAWATAAGIA